MYLTLISSVLSPNSENLTLNWQAHGYSEICTCVPTVIPTVMILHFAGCSLWPCSSGRSHQPPRWTTSVIVVLYFYYMARRIKILSVRCKVQLFSHFKKFQFRLWNWDTGGCINLSNSFSSQTRTLEWVSRRWGRIRREKLIWHARGIGKCIFDRSQGAQGKEEMRGSKSKFERNNLFVSLRKNWGVIKQDTKKWVFVWSEGKRREALKSKAKVGKKCDWSKFKAITKT